jgi:hypothetical protein
VTVRQQVFLRFGLLALGFGLVGAVQPGAATEPNIGSELFGFTGAMASIVSLLVLAPASFVLGGCFGLLGRVMFANVFQRLDHIRRGIMLRKLIESERRLPWMPSIFFLFGIDHNGLRIK